MNKRLAEKYFGLAYNINLFGVTVYIELNRKR